MHVLAEPLPGLLVLQPPSSRDRRGSFTKFFHTGMLSGLGIHFDVQEAFLSTSAKGVLRGMHFQVPPCSQAKIVQCLSGAILDVVLDLRSGTPSFGRWASIWLAGDPEPVSADPLTVSPPASALVPPPGSVLFIPKGFAHGFLSFREDSRVLYLADAWHSPAHDCGLRYDSFGMPWPIPPASLVISDRDLALPPFSPSASLFPPDHP